MPLPILVLVAALLLCTHAVAAEGEAGADAPLEMAFSSVSGFRGPEAVRYDPDQDIYFVANFNGDTKDDSNGFVSKVSPDGDILDLEFMQGTDAHPFHAGRGMYIDGDHLWVADAYGVHRFDRRTGQHAGFVDLSAFDPGFPNDIIVTADGTLYVTDTGTDVIYRIVDGVASIASTTPYSANGIAIDPKSGAFVIVPWDGGDYVAVWDARSDDYSTLAEFAGGGNFDGLEFIGDSLFVASQVDETLHVIEGGEDTKRIALAGRPADIGVDTRRGRIIVPYVALDRIDIFDWPQ